MPLNLDIDNTTLEILSTKLKNSVSSLDIIRWLGNFEKQEIPLAIKILSNLTIYTTYEIEEILDRAFIELFGETISEGGHLFVNAVGAFGKSGSMIAYFFQKTTFYKNRKNTKNITLIDDPTAIDIDLSKQNSLILIDDFVGSGRSIREYIELHKDKIKVFQNIYFVGIAAMEKGISNISPLFKRVIIDRASIFKKAFAADASYFGYRNYKPYRDLAYKYGIRISSKLEKIGKTRRYTEALGFENSQALVSFVYGSPNNTLPIIWGNKEGWIPLIPRFSIDKVYLARKLRKTISYELSILKEFGSSNLQSTFFSYKALKGNKVYSSVSQIDFALYGIIKLSRAGFLPVNICQKLGIMFKDYEEYLQYGKERDIFEEDNNLSTYGLSLYQDAKKCIELNKRALSMRDEMDFKIRDISYTPKQFNGRS
ncbi:phosphoribosyltransferase-like protein [Sphingobacterium multivorum]|uniref:phosphoribosyltransferase-like protein n=1 Tax=Sphingobacterium multivorum TaxID=28454 RepID=UPI003DA319AE